MIPEGGASLPSATDHKYPSRSDWDGPDGPIGAYISEECEKSLEAYRYQPNLILEHANHEQDTARGGYADRQLFELVQNSADALAGAAGGRIWIKLTATHLYCADEGQPIDTDGVRALMFAHLSSKRGTAEIGRFGVGFKSVLGVTDAPAFFSRAGSFRFDRGRADELLRPIAPDYDRYPVLRLPEAIDPWPEMETDPVLRELMGWAVNIVRLPLISEAQETLREQLTDFPPEFLLFVQHVSQLTLQNDVHQGTLTFTLSRKNGHQILNDGENTSRWMVTTAVHSLSLNAKSDSRTLDDASEVPISWAAPIDRLNEPGRFWAFFPTITESLLGGILNAPWKTNEDRQNLLPGVYNDELIDAAAALVASVLPQLSTPDNPARHLDALPRREEAGDSEHSNLLRDRLYSSLHGIELVPDQNCNLRKLSEVFYPPRALTGGDAQSASASLDSWAGYRGRPSNWLHHSALNRNRMATLERLHDHAMPERIYSLPRASIAQWLESLLNTGPVASCPEEGSKAAIKTAALIPLSIRANSRDLGNIVLTSTGDLVKSDPEAVFLGGGLLFSAKNLVHEQLERDPETLEALKKLGIKPASAATVFSDAAAASLAHGAGTRNPDPSLIDAIWREFWQLSRDVELPEAVDIIRANPNWRDSLRIRTSEGTWGSLFRVLLPGRVVPGDGSRDSSVAVDTVFHGADLTLLKELGAVDAPRAGYELSQTGCSLFTHSKRTEFVRRDLPRSPRRDMLNFNKVDTSGPLEVLEELSDEGRACYTWRMLDLLSTYEPWTMRHDTQDIYPPLQFESPALETLREYGRVSTDDGIGKLSDGLGPHPQNVAVLNALLSHPQSASIRRAFGLELETIDSPLEPIGEDTPILLADVWPGLEAYLPAHQLNLELIRCDQLLRNDGAPSDLACVLQDGTIYVTRRQDENEGEDLIAILREVGRNLTDDQIEKVLLHETAADVKAAREAVRQCPTDEERLLCGVGKAGLRRRLPPGLLAILEEEMGTLSGVQIAEAAIATFHSGALREYRHSLSHLDPPGQWAGTQRAVEFVRSLGFSEDWAGDRKARRDPYIEVEGPYSLPELHDYQRRIVQNVRTMIHSNGTVGERRGMISMPTGSGKTRVAVQAVVEAIREDGFQGGILWVADRDELCEQAVEAWRQVWSSEGTQATQLRVSRMWSGQPPPKPTTDLHVIVATIQTLSAKNARQPETYEFLADFKLLVFDEAHRSVAPTFTSVMSELGLTRYRREQEPFLMGLTATPYRGHDEVETARLVNRYSSNRLDTGAFSTDNPEGVIRELQTMRVLARADHAIIEGGGFSMSTDELRQSQQTPWLPQSVENRIALDSARTSRIIQAYFEKVSPDWPTLIFATSVEHSQTIAALLTSKGVKARSVSASTDTASRRRIVDEFRAGEIKALVNYGIFREGFDAPKTRAIIVARPVYSPNLYFQMIGRGLRGVKNGGNDQCLILNVRDNIANFQRRLAFTDLDWLWA